MHDIDLILTLTGGIAAAALLGYLALRLGLSPLVGYLLAGVMVGPHTPGFVADRSLAEQLAEVGVILLMFGVGLQFHLHDLLAVRRIAVPGAILTSAVALSMGLTMALVLGWGLAGGLVFGLALSVSSTVVLTRVLSDRGELHSPVGRVAIGWLVVEDILTVVVLVLLPSLLGDGAGDESLVAALLFSALRIAVLVALTLVVGGRVVPLVMARVAETRSRELFTLTVLVVALGVAVGAAKVFGVSMALGAFLAGMVVGRSEFSLRAAVDALPMRDAFAVLFFVSSGMLFDPQTLWRYPGSLLAASAIVLLLKPCTAMLSARKFGLSLPIAIPLGMSLSQIGEFSFMLSALGRRYDALPEEAVQVLVGTALITMVLNPFIVQASGASARALSFLEPAEGVDRTAVGSGRASSEKDPAHRAVIIGYGPVGRSVARLLLENGVDPVVVELNLETARQLKVQGIRFVYGNADQADVLKAAGVMQARSLIFSSDASDTTGEVIRLARELNPKIRIHVRSHLTASAAGLMTFGASTVVCDEREVTLGFIEIVLRDLGATAEQIDRERDRYRRELTGPSMTRPGQPG